MATSTNRPSRQTGPEGGDGHVKRAILERYAFYRNGEPALQADIERAANVVHVEPGSRFFDVGQSCAQVALVGQGSVRVFLESESGREITLYHVAPGETCPVNLLCVLLGRPAPATALVEERLSAALLPTEIFRRWVAEEPVVRQFVLEAVAIRLVDILSLLEEITFGRLDRRLADFLLRRAEPSGRSPASVVELTHEQIALELSTAREVVSRLLREFERRGAVELARGCIQVRDAAVLEELRD
jgi:CRP/FNR family transcriptional regulator, anaerobic regulatory protein